MQTKDNILKDSSFTKLLYDDNYYQHIFKKTEKIVSVVFYILNNIDIEKKSETHTSNLASKAHFAHENALRSLEVKPANAAEVLEQFAQALVGLQSTLNVVAVARVIAPDVVQVVVNEIGVVLQNLNRYIAPDKSIASDLFAGEAPAPAPSKRPSVPTRGSSAPASNPPAPNARAEANSAGTDRRTRIFTILEAKGDATIKDISEIISDVSEKTIQRELNAMIEEGKVERQGERRWSRYRTIG